MNATERRDRSSTLILRKQQRHRLSSLEIVKILAMFLNDKLLRANKNVIVI
jgi:hypothetical protein